MHTDRAAHPFLTKATSAAMAAVVTVVTIFALGRASSDATIHAALVLATTGASIVALWFGLRDQRELRSWAIAGIVATLAVGLVVGGLRSRPTTIDERVVMVGPTTTAPARDVERDDAMAPAAPARNVLVASGDFRSLEHAGRGTASIIRTATGRNVLTLTDFRTDAGPDLVVMLVPGNPTDDRDVERTRTLDLGALKATRGDQQYVLPKGVDPSRYSHVYVWCRAFSVGFTRAQLG